MVSCHRLACLQMVVLLFVNIQVTSEADVKKALQTAKAKFGRLDVAVSCAGIGIAAVTYNPKKDTVHVLEDFMKVVTVCHCFQQFGFLTRCVVVSLLAWNVAL